MNGGHRPESVLIVRDLWKKYRIWHERRLSLKEVVLRRGRGRYEDFWALSGVTFEVDRGETFGIVGENGSGKSTLLKLMAGILVPTRGELGSRGRISALLELGAGFHPELSGRENIFLNGSILGLSRRQIAKSLDEIIEFSGLEQFIDTPIRSYSSGMYVRLGFSIAIHSHPDILLVDEVLAVGDEAFQRKSAERILKLRDAGTTIIVVSHALDLVRGLCGRAIWLHHGTIKARGVTDQVIQAYLENVEERLQTPAEPEGEFEAAPRSGGKVLVKRIEMFGETQAAPLRTGRPASIRVHFSALEQIERPSIGIGIHRSDGLYLTGPNTREAGVEIDGIRGDGVVELLIDKLALLPGSYQISASITDYTSTHPYDIQDRTLSVEVRSGDFMESRGIITLGGKWRLIQGAVPERERS